jgi:hypothetical protein
VAAARTPFSSMGGSRCRSGKQRASTFSKGSALGDNSVSSCRSYSQAKRSSHWCRSVSDGTFPIWRGRVIDGVPRGHVGPPGPLELPALGSTAAASPPASNPTHSTQATWPARPPPAPAGPRLSRQTSSCSKSAAPPPPSSATCGRIGTPHARGLGQHGADRQQAGRRKPPSRSVRSHCHFNNRGTEYLSESGMKCTSSSAKRQCDRALPSRGGPPAARPPPRARRPPRRSAPRRGPWSRPGRARAAYTRYEGGGVMKPHPVLVCMENHYGARE